MANGIDNKAFDLMNVAADETDGKLLSMVQDLKPEVVKSIRSVSPYLRGYKIPFFGKKKAEKDYEKLVKALKENRIKVTEDFNEAFEKMDGLPLTGKLHGAYHGGYKYNPFMIDKGRAWGGQNLIYINKDLSKEEKMSTLLHELLHGQTSHGISRNVKEDIISRTLFPSSTGSFNYQSKKLLEKRSVSEY
ncbi:hypothetical protein CMI47_21750 [Candidatus Pacearchaeota archaeon]|jgi:hypothetical protein|nr:hypothetical protein [Candidatus Pacearchaeota archaeon]|tara:strand:+ start:780 stop:1349 length:570 start_codon:yes stop_codon:yes gene_type:complete